MIIKARRENRVASILMMLDIRKSSVIHSSFLRLIYYWRAADGKILFFFWRNLFYERKLDWFWYIRNSFIFIRLYRGWLMAVSFLKPPECQRILRLLILPTNDVSLCLYSTYRVAPYCPTENPDTSFVEKKEREKPFFFFYFILLIREGRELFHHTEDFRATPVLIPFFMIYYFFCLWTKKETEREKADSLYRSISSLFQTPHESEEAKRDRHPWWIKTGSSTKCVVCFVSLLVSVFLSLSPCSTLIRFHQKRFSFFP